MKNIDAVLGKINMYELQDITADSMSQDMKQRIYENTMKKIGEKKVRPFVKKANRWAKAAAVVAALILIPGTVAVAAHVLHWNGKIAALFGRDMQEDTEIVNSIQDVSMHDTEEGVTVAVEQVLGDESGFYTLLHVSGLSQQMKEKIQYMPVSFEEYDFTVEDDKDAEISRLMDMGTDYESGDNYFIIKVNSSKVIDSNVSLTLKNLVVKNGENSQEPLVQGEWRIDWKLNYKNDATVYQVGKEVTLGGETFTWKSVSISPLSVTIHISPEKGNKVSTDDIKEMFYVDFADGSRLDARYVNDGYFYQSGEMATISFERIHKITDIVSVTFAKETYLIQEAKLQKKVRYENTEMNFTLQISQELADILHVETSGQYHDTDFDVNAQKAEFIAQKDDVTMTMFTIYALYGEFTKDQCEMYNPMAAYLTCKDGVTYILQYGEIITEDQMIFADILNRDVTSIKYYFDVK